MARGSDLLFNPPTLKRKTSATGPALLLEEARNTAFPLRGLVREGGQLITLQERDGGKFSLLRHRPGQSKSIMRQNLIKPGGSVYGLSPEGYFAAEEDGDVLFFGPDGQREVYPWDMPGEILYLFGTEDVIYNVWRDEADLAAVGHSTLRLSAIRRDDSFEWQEIFSYPGGSLRVEQRGERSVFIYDEDEDIDDIISLMTLGSEGPGDVYPLPPGAAAAISRDLYTFSQMGERMLAPGVEDGQYYYVNIGEEGADLHFLDLPKGIDRPIVSLAKDREELAVFLDQQERVRLRSSGDRLALMLKGELLLVEQERGLLEKVDLEEDYSEIDFSEDRITLFSFDKKGYREVTVR